jgi:hypothetical protein
MIINKFLIENKKEFIQNNNDYIIEYRINKDDIIVELLNLFLTFIHTLKLM